MVVSVAKARPPAALLSGSFNPLHAGHEYLAQAAAVLLDTPVTFELPVLNADKPPLRYIELERRLDQFRGRYPVVLTRAPLFVQKADLFPGCTFVIGYDTALRIIDPRYYDGEAGRDAAFARIAAQRCTFLVAGRVRDGIFRTLADIDMPPALRPPLPRTARTPVSHRPFIDRDPQRQRRARGHMSI
jgi:hypothetical protein